MSNKKTDASPRPRLCPPPTIQRILYQRQIQPQVRQPSTPRRRPPPHWRFHRYRIQGRQPRRMGSSLPHRMARLFRFSHSSTWTTGRCVEAVASRTPSVGRDSPDLQELEPLVFQPFEFLASGGRCSVFPRWFGGLVTKRSEEISWQISPYAREK